VPRRDQLGAAAGGRRALHAPRTLRLRRRRGLQVRIAITCNVGMAPRELLPYMAACASTLGLPRRPPARTRRRRRRRRRRWWRGSRAIARAATGR
jgi:hypothetical protein